MSLPTLHFEIGELEYSIKVESYSPPTNPTRDDPGDTGECELARFALVYTNGELIGCVPYSVFVLDYAVYCYSVTQDYLEYDRLDQAERSIYDKAMDACAESSEESYWYDYVDCEED